MFDTRGVGHLRRGGAKWSRHWVPQNIPAAPSSCLPRIAGEGRAAEIRRPSLFSSAGSRAPAQDRHFGVLLTDLLDQASPLRRSWTFSLKLACRSTPLGTLAT